jgi:parvulin-like peptidyl-prolyl isomerase
MTRTRLSLVAPAALVVFGALLAAGCGGGSGSSSSSGSNGVPSDAVATVTGQPITRAQLDDLLAVTKLTYKQQKQQFPKAGTAEYQALQQQAVSYLVAQKEYEQEIARRGQTVTTADVDKALTNLVKQRFNGSETKFEAFLKSTGYTKDQFQSGLHRQLVEQRLHDDVTKGITVSDAAMKAYYDKNKSSTTYTTPAQRRVRHILVAVNKSGVGIATTGIKDAKVDFAKSKVLADKLYQQLAAGASFPAYVKKYSQDPGSKDKGGEYTDVKGTFAKEFEQAAFTLGTNVISKPVKTEFGYHLIQPLGATKEAATISYAKAKAGIRTLLVQQKQQPVIDSWGTQFKKRYKNKVKYAAGFAPPAPTTTGATTSP